MARPERKTVDYFPHFISDGKKMFFIESKYGNDGYAVWFKLLESLASTDDHFLDLSNPMDLMFMSAKCRVTDEALKNILNDLSTIGEIDKEMWNIGIVWSDKFVSSIEDAYRKRSSKLQTLLGLRQHLISIGRIISAETPVKGVRNTQRKEKETKVDKPAAAEKEIMKTAFDGFWNFYGKKSDKKKCFDKWMANVNLSNIDHVRSSLKIYIAATQKDIQFRKNPLTWLNGQCWLDYPIDAKFELGRINDSWEAN